MSPKRGDRVAPPPVGLEWDLRFATTEAAKGWANLCQQARGNARRAYEMMRDNPLPAAETPRHHRMRDVLAFGSNAGKRHERWQIEITGGGRIWYLVDHEARTIWIDYAGTGHPKATD